MDGLIVIAIIWFVIRMVASSAKKQAEARRKAVRDEAGGYQPAPAQQQQSKPRGLGEWAEMLGKLVGEESPAAQKPAVPASPWQNDAAFPPAPRRNEPTPQKIARPVAPVLAPAFGMEQEEFTPAQPTREAPVMDAQDFLPQRWDAPALVKGVIFAEILTRPVHRRRPGMR